jgi:hypothetical protein
MSNKRERILVPHRAINGGMDVKFETDPYDVKLHGIMTAAQYTDAMRQLNDRLKPSRSKKIDTFLLATGPLMVPLALWGVRHRHLTKKRKRLMTAYIDDFNAANPTLFMRWNRRPESFLTIERRNVDLHGMPPPRPPGLDELHYQPAPPPPGVVHYHGQPAAAMAAEPEIIAGHENPRMVYAQAAPLKEPHTLD